MLDTDTNAQQEIPYYKNFYWYLKEFTSIIVIVITTAITMFVTKQANLKWIAIACGAYLLALLVCVITVICVDSHYNNKHGSPVKCQKAISENCKKIEKCSFQCAEIANNLNAKVLEQEVHFKEVEDFVANAKKLEKLYLDAVGKLLRTNKDVAKIEASAKADSVIYIMTTSFLFEKYDEDMRRSIASNIMRGVKYRYIIPSAEKEEFKEMVYVIMAEIQQDFKEASKTMLEGANDFLKAVQIPREYCMLTIAYYELDEELSSVIVKLPADDIAEVNEQEALTYLVPVGNVVKKGRQKYNSEHKVFLDNMAEIFQNGKNNELVFCKSELVNAFHNGVIISPETGERIKLKEEV